MLRELKFGIKLIISSRHVDSLDVAIGSGFCDASS